MAQRPPEYAAGDVVRLILWRLGGVRNPRKLVLLAFFADYERVGDVVIKYLYGGEPLSRAKFYVWTHVIMSNEVWRAVEGGAVKVGTDGLGRTILYADAEPRLPPEVRAWLVGVLAKYGELKYSQLERLALRLLRLRREDLADYVGMWVDDYLKETGLGPRSVELGTMVFTDVKQKDR